MGRLRWRRQPDERGLARVCQRKRGADLTDGSKILAMVRPVTPDGLWHWYGSGVNTLQRSTNNRMFATIEEAKADAMRTIKVSRLATMIESKLGSREAKPR